MDGNLKMPPLARLLNLNTEIHEMRNELLRQPLAPHSSGPARIAELQEGIDRCHRASLATCWLNEGYELDDAGDEYYFNG